MTDLYRLTIEETPAPDDVAAVREGLNAFNWRHVPTDNYTPLHLFVRDEAGTVVGGLIGCTYWGWLYVEILWLADGVRRHGWGSRLLAEAEGIAVGRGCHAAHLDTMDFQARAFYEGHGYSVFGTLDDLPPGHQRIFLHKRLQERTRD